MSQVPPYGQQYNANAYQQNPPAQNYNYPPPQQNNYPPAQPNYPPPNNYVPQQPVYQAPVQYQAYPQQEQAKQPYQASFEAPIHDQNVIAPKDPFLVQQEEGAGLMGASFDERKGFIVKVYTLLSLQLGVTFLFCVIANFSPGFRDLLTKNNTLSVFSWVCFAISFITEIAIFCCKGVAKKVPNNYIALFIFTVTFSVVIAATCSVCYNAFSNGGTLVLISALLTFAVTAALTAYACTTKTDITMKGGALWIIAIVLLTASIISIFYFSLILQVLICCLVIICYGFYLIYDTQLIMGGKAHELSIDDYVIATMLIYIDIIILFLRILQILMILFGKK
ncbi:hypothetical protein pb186bvf_003265 [Paramecium bursaria]